MHPPAMERWYTALWDPGGEIILSADGEFSADLTHRRPGIHIVSKDACLGRLQIVYEEADMHPMRFAA